LRSNRHNEVVIQLKPLQLIQPWITLNCFTRYSQASSIFAFILEFTNFEKEKIQWPLYPREWIWNHFKISR